MSGEEKYVRLKKNISKQFLATVITVLKQRKVFVNAFFNINKI